MPARGRLLVRVGAIGAGLAMPFAAHALLASGRWRFAAYAAGVPHALIYLALLCFFGLSLRPGHVPTVTWLSHKIHGVLPEPIDRYTRRVTWVWCLFFVTQLTGSALLVALAPLAWWSIFVNVLNVPLLLSLFIGEKLFRPLWMPDAPRERLRDIPRMILLVRDQMARRRGSDAGARAS